jgi:hypothetical protein
MTMTNAIISIGAIALSATMMTGMVHSKQFQQAAVVETSGFDALAHDLFAAGTPAAKAPGARVE